MRRFFFLALILALLGLPRLEAQPFDAGYAMVELVTDHISAEPGDKIRGALVLDIDEHWHVYWENPGDSGLPADIIWGETSFRDVGAFAWPLPHAQPFDILMNYGYENRLVLPFDIDIPADAVGSIDLFGSAQYLICSDICIPEEAPIQASIAIGPPQIDELSQNAFAWADAHMPAIFTGEAVIDRSAGEDWKLSVKDDIIRAAFKGDIEDARFFPLDHQILHPPTQAASIGPDGVTLSLQEAKGLGTDGDLSGVLVLEDVEGNRVGFELTASPGAILPGTTGAALSDLGSSEGAVGDALTPLSLLGLLGAALLGGAILNLMPCVLPVLFIKARSMLTLIGHEDEAKIRPHGVFYLIGVIACFLVLGLILALLISAGELVGLGFQLQIPIVVAGLALLMFVLGLNMIGMFDFGSSLMGVGSGLAEKSGNAGAFFTGVLAAFVGAPCIGPFIGAATGVVVTQPIAVILLVFFFLGLGMALPFALISFFPSLFKALPKPGPWMERLKQFFAFPLFLTAIWLLWVLGQQAGIDAVAALSIGAVLLTFGIWVFTAAPDKGTLRKAAHGLGIVALIIGLALPLNQVSQTAQASTDGSAKIDGASPYDDVWSPDTVNALIAEGRPVFVDFTASWCVTCQVNKRTTLTQASVQSAFEANNVEVLVADWTRRDRAIGEELARHERAGVPLYLYYPAGETEPQILPQLLTPDIIMSMLNP